MGISIRTNIAALDAENNLDSNQNMLNKSLQRLSSGYRINTASDDAAGSFIADGLTSQVNGLNQAVRNGNDGTSMLQTADGGMTAIDNMLQRMRELAVQGANGDLSLTDQNAISAEMTQLQGQVDNIATSTQFNGINLLNNNANTITLQVGANNATDNQLNVSFSDFRITGGSVAAMSTLGTDITTYSGAATAAAAQTSAQTMITDVDAAVTSLNTQRSQIGAYENRVSYAVQNVTSESENLSAAQSQIKDVDVASESANMSAATVLVQAGVSVLSQANQVSQLALKLLG